MSTPSQIKASVKLQARMRKVHLTARQMVFADLLAIGYEPRDAYQLSGLYDNILMPGENWKIMHTLMETNEAFNNYIPPFKANTDTLSSLNPKKKKPEPEPVQIKDVPKSEDTGSAQIITQVTEEELNNFLSKDNQLKELVYKLKNEELDIQSELKIRQMIADITNAKKEKTQAEEKRTSFALPLKCFMCSLYNEAKMKKNKKG